MSTFDLTMSINFLLDPLALLQIEPSFVQAANNPIILTDQTKQVIQKILPYDLATTFLRTETCSECLAEFHYVRQ